MKSLWLPYSVEDGKFFIKQAMHDYDKRSNLEAVLIILLLLSFLGFLVYQVYIEY